MGGFYIRINDEDAQVVEWMGDEDDLLPAGEDTPFSYAEDFNDTAEGDSEDNTLHDDGHLRVYTGRPATARAAIEHLEDQMEGATEEEQAAIQQNIARLKGEMQVAKPKKRPSQTGNTSG